MIRLHGWTRHPRLFLCAVLTLVWQPILKASAQDTTRVPTVTLLKRIAEAVDGRRIGGNVFVVTNVDSMNVTAVLPSRDDAQAMLARLGPRYVLHGPFRGDIDLGPLDHIVPEDCVHDGLSAYIPRGICPPEMLSNLSRISLVFTRRDGTAITTVLPPSIDAIFLNLSAFDKFVFPYYDRVMGVERTAAWRAQMIQGLRRRVP